MVGRTTRWKSFRINGARKKRVAVITQEWARIEKGMFHPKFSKDIVRFLHKSDL